MSMNDGLKIFNQFSAIVRLKKTHYHFYRFCLFFREKKEIYGVLFYFKLLNSDSVFFSRKTSEPYCTRLHCKDLSNVLRYDFPISLSLFLFLIYVYFRK